MFAFEDELLRALECPFYWNYNFITDIHDIIIRIEGKLCECEAGDKELLQWKCFILNVILCFEYARKGDLDVANEKQSLCDRILDDAIEGSFVYMGFGLRHISLACKCYLLWASNMRDESLRIFNKIVPFDKLSEQDQAIVLAAKGAYCAEYGYTGVKESIKLFEKAVDLDHRAEFFYLLGRSLGRLRRLEKRFAIPEKRELEALEMSVEKTDNLSFMVLLAQAYRETSRCVFNHHVKGSSNTKDIDCKAFCDTLNKQSYETYMKALRKGMNDVHALIRCSLGFMKLPKPWRNMNQSRFCLLRALDLSSENPMANHVAGMYYKFAKKHELSMKYFSKAAACGVFGAEIDLIIAKKRNNESYDPLADLERLLPIYPHQPRQENILCHLGAYYYARKDIKTAFKYWFQVLEADIYSEALKLHFEAVSYDNRAMNINKIIIKEILNLLNNGMLTETEIQLYNEIINEYIKHLPQYVFEYGDIDTSKYINQKFEYNSWRKGQ